MRKTDNITQRARRMTSQSNSYTVKQTGNRIDLIGARIPIFYEVSGIELPELQDHSFAVWHLLPSCMKTGQSIHIDGPVDPDVIKNAMEFSRIWELWEPTKFRQVLITSSEESATPIENCKKREKQLACFSGGIDSTHMLLNMGIQEKRGTILGIHGMEIHYDNKQQFEELANWTKPLLEYLNYDRVTVRTNASKIGGGHHSWALSLAGNAYLFRQLFEECVFASDFTAAEDFVSFPYGSNSISNLLLAGRDYRLRSLCNQFSRVDKLEPITKDHIALQTVTFCKQKHLRPQNCGICDKCIRTKIMMIVASGHIAEEIFIDPRLNRKLVHSLNFSDKIEQTFFISTCQLAREKNVLSKIPGIEEKFYAIQNPLSTRIRRFFRRYK